MSLDISTNIKFIRPRGYDEAAAGVWVKGVTLRFPNGYKLSIQCGETNYCTKTSEEGGTTDAEIAVIAPDGSWATKEVVAGALGESLEDDVRGCTTVSEIAKIMAHLDTWLGE